MTDTVRAIQPPGVLGTLWRIRGALDGISYTWLALPLRFAVATVFWNSAMAKLANWETTLSLFSDEYQLPLIPPQNRSLSGDISRDFDGDPARARAADKTGCIRSVVYDGDH
jgi:hypothetical protein